MRRTLNRRRNNKTPANIGQMNFSTVIGKAVTFYDLVVMVWSESESVRHFNEILVKLRLFRPVSFLSWMSTRCRLNLQKRMPAILPTPKTGSEAKNFELKVILYKGPFSLANLFFFFGRPFYNVRSPNGDLKILGLETCTILKWTLSFLSAFVRYVYLCFYSFEKTLWIKLCFKKTLYEEILVTP